MKQLLQNLGTGAVEVLDVPAPASQQGRVLVRTACSLISAGTDRLTVELGKKSLIGKARERPDLVRQVIQRAKQEGLQQTLATVRTKLDAWNALGYSASGIIVNVGEGIQDLRAGDRVACAGAGYASHAEVLSVPQNLCVRVPDAVDFESASFGTLGAIALQGVRLAEPTLGESVVVIGLGLLGQLAAQLLRANGCRVFGIDLDASKIELARQFGADDGAVASGEGVKEAVMRWSRGRGADAVLITAATSSDEPIELAGEISRLKGRVVAVGLVGMNVPRKIYFERELTLRVSMSYGPGRYDAEYEERGHDYPLPYVRWTERRNIEAFLDMIAAGRIDTKPLITHRFSIEEGARAYQLISGETREPYLGVVINYDAERELEARVENRARVLDAARKSSASARVGFIGAGGYAQKFLLPNFKAEGADLLSIATASGLTARNVGERFGFARYVSNAEDVIGDEEINLVVIATRHDTHARLARLALEHNRHVFVEKPLALNEEELDGVIEAAKRSQGQLMVGFNRRFSPHARAAREFFAERRAPLSILYRVNAGRIARDHWTQDAREGGGRIIGEVCHFIDLMHFLTGSHTTRVYAESIAARDHALIDADSVFVTLRFADGSNGTIAYLAEGDRALPKERIEIYGEGKTFVIDDFRIATSYTNGREKALRLRAQDKGQREEVRACLAAVSERQPAPIALEDLAATTRATFRILESLQTGERKEVMSNE